jgi:hypothetical protein
VPFPAFLALLGRKWSAGGDGESGFFGLDAAVEAAGLEHKGPPFVKATADAIDLGWADILGMVILRTKDICLAPTFLIIRVILE